MKYIEKGWENYRRLIPTDASEMQIRETQQAFYAGAALLFESLMRMLDPGEDATENDMQRMANLQRELDDFGQQLDRRYFGKQEH